MLTLYIGNKNYSSWSMRAWVLMRQSGIEFTEHKERFDSFEAQSQFKHALQALNPHSLKVVQAIVEPSLCKALPDDKFQFERHGYFVADRLDHKAEKPVFNLAVGLKDSFGK